jgi:hypothetical protein
MNTFSRGCVSFKGRNEPALQGKRTETFRSQDVVYRVVSCLDETYGDVSYYSSTVLYVGEQGISVMNTLCYGNTKEWTNPTLKDTFIEGTRTLMHGERTTLS